MGKIYKGVWGCISRLNYISGGGGHGTRTNGWPSASLIRGGDGGGRYTGSGKGRYSGVGCFSYYIKNNLFIINF